MDGYFAGRPGFERTVYDAVMAHLRDVGPVHAEAVAVGILVKRVRTFAELRPKRGRVSLSVLLSRRADGPRIARILPPLANRFAHFIDLYGEDDIDAEVRDLLTEAYLASPA